MAKKKNKTLPEVSLSQSPCETTADRSLEEKLSRLEVSRDGDLTEESNIYWLEIINLIKAEEEDRLRSEGIVDSRLNKLIRTAWASVAPGEDFLTILEEPLDKARKAVRVLQLFQENQFVIHPTVSLMVKWVFQNRSDRPRASRGSRDFVFGEIKEMEKISREAKVEGLSPLQKIASLIQPANSKVSCGILVIELRQAIDRVIRNTDEGLKSNSSEPNGALFSLIELSIRAGKALERHRILHDQDGESAIRLAHTNPPGSQPRPAGKALRQLLWQFEREFNMKPTATLVTKWLVAERPGKDDGPLVVSHPLWVDELKEVSWSKLSNAVRSYNRSPKR